MAEIPARTVLFTDLVPVKRSETEVYRGNEKTPTLSVKAPAYGVFNSKGTDRIIQVSRAREIGTDRPNRLEIHYSNSARAIVAVPVLVTEQNENEDLFEIVWNDDQGRAAVNLLELLQPRNMSISRGQIMELPLWVQMIPELNGDCLVIDMSEPTYRNVREDVPSAVAAASQG